MHDDRLTTARSGPGMGSFERGCRCLLRAQSRACLGMLPDRCGPKARDLFRLVEIEGRPLSHAARILGLGPDAARELLAETRRQVAMLLAHSLAAGDASAGPCSPCAAPNSAPDSTPPPGPHGTRGASGTG